MEHRYIPTRRVLLAAGAASLATMPLRAQALPEVVVTKDPSCACCDAWVEHLKSAGFSVRITMAAPNQLKVKLKVPRELFSCHTAEVGGYVAEGHVPASMITRLLAEKPSAIGLAVPRMPIGSPGMEVEGEEPDTYDVVLFGSFGQRPYARFRGAQEI